VKNAKDLLIKSNALIIDALKQLEATKERVLICVNETGHFAGVIADGDIRRALIAGYHISSPLNVCIRKDAIFVSCTASYQQVMQLISDRVRVVPVVDESHKVVGYYSYRQKRNSEDIKLQRVAIFGMGYVGLTLAVSLADCGFSVKGFDINEVLVEKLQAKKAPFFEIGLRASLETLVGRNLHFSSKINHISSDIFIIAVGTPVDEATKKPEMDSLVKAALSIGKLLKQGDTVILRSTIPVGCSRNIVLPELEKASGLVCGEQFHFVFAPERSAEGRALPELRSNPQIIGGYDTKSAEVASQLFNTITPSVINVGSTEAAELCKLMDNCYRDHIFSFINQLVPFAEQLGLDLCNLVDAVNFGYERNNIPKPSPGVGGPCLPKDPYILADGLGHKNDASLLHASRRANEFGPEHVYNKLVRLLAKTGKNIDQTTISLVGLAFKGDPETSDLRGSTALKVLDQLHKTSARVLAYDPIVPERELIALSVNPVDLEGAFDGADAVVVLNNHRSYSNWNLPSLVGRMRHPAVFIDTWHIFEPLYVKMLAGIVYGGVGND